MVDAALLPSGHSADDPFRLLFITSVDNVQPTSGNIATYNTHVQNLAEASTRAGIPAIKDEFCVIGSTAGVDARDNTATAPTDTSAAIYWVGGIRVANPDADGTGYTDFYNGWTNGQRQGGRDENGGGETREVWTGSNADGTVFSNIRLGSTIANVSFGGVLRGTGHEIRSGNGNKNNQRRGYYGLSGLLTVTEASASSDATLSTLTLSAGTLAQACDSTQGFAPNIEAYTATVANSVSSVTVTPTVADSGARVTVGGTSVTSGSASAAVMLMDGVNPAITIQVTAADTSTTKTYTITITREAAATPPMITGITLPSPTNAPAVMFTSDKAGTATLGGACGPTTETIITAGDTTIPLTATNGDALAEDTYNDCTLTVTAGGTTHINLTAFTVDTTPPVITLTGTNTITLLVGDTYTEAGATAEHAADGTPSVTTGGETVDTNT